MYARQPGPSRAASIDAGADVRIVEGSYLHKAEKGGDPRCCDSGLVMVAFSG